MRSSDIRMIAVMLALCTYTPIEFFLNLSISEIDEYIEIVKQIKKRPKQGGT